MPPKRRSRAKSGAKSDGEQSVTPADTSHSVSPALNPLDMPPPPPPPAGGHHHLLAPLPPAVLTSDAATAMSPIAAAKPTSSDHQSPAAAASSELDDGAALATLVDAASAASKVFDSSLSNTKQRLAQAVGTVNAVAATACAAVQHRNALLQSASTLAADNRVLRSACEGLQQATTMTTTQHKEATATQQGQESESPSSSQGTQQQQQQQQQHNTLNHKADQCIQKTFDSIRMTSTQALDAVITAQKSAMKGRHDAISGDIERQAILLRLRGAKETIAEKDAQINELQEALRVATRDKSSKEDLQRLQIEIKSLKEALRSAESATIASSSAGSDGSIAAAADDDKGTLASSLRFLDERDWTISELVQKYRNAKADEEQLRQQVRDQAAEISSAKSDVARLTSEATQSSWRMEHLEQLLNRTGQNFHNSNNTNFDRDVLNELSCALNAKAAACVMLDDAQRKLADTRSALSKLEVEYDISKKMLDQNEMLALFKESERRRDAVALKYKQRFEQSQVELQEALTANTEFKSQYEALKGLVLTLQSSTEMLSSKLRTAESLLAKKTNEAKELSGQLMVADRQQQQMSSSGNSSSSRLQLQVRESGGAASQNVTTNNRNNGCSLALIDSFTRLEKAAVQLVDKLVSSSSSNEAQNNSKALVANTDDAAETTTTTRTVSSPSTSNNSSPALLNFVLSSVNDALQTAERVRVSLLGQITDLSVELESVRASHSRATNVLEQTQQRLQQAEANIERSSGAFASAVLHREHDDSEMRIAALQRSVSKLEETESKNRLQSDQIAVLTKSCDAFREELHALATLLATAEGRLVASVFREETARREAIATSEMNEFRNVALLASLSAATASALDLGEAGSSPVDSDDAGVSSGNGEGEEQGDTENNNNNNNKHETLSLLRGISDKIRDATSPIDALHHRLTDAVDSAVQEEEENQAAATLSLSKLCTVLDSVLSFWRSAATREQQHAQVQQQTVSATSAFLMQSAASTSARSNQNTTADAAEDGQGAAAQQSSSASSSNADGALQLPGMMTSAEASALVEKARSEMTDKLTEEVKRREALEAQLSDQSSRVTTLEEKNTKLTRLVEHYTKGSS